MTNPQVTNPQVPERAPDFSQSVLDDVYRYRTKDVRVAWALWLVTGLMGTCPLYSVLGVSTCARESTG